MRIYEFCVLIWNLNYIENFVIASLPCYLSVFVSLSMTIVLYTGAYDIAGNRTPKWVAGGFDSLIWMLYLFLKLLMYILKSLWRRIFVLNTIMR